MIREREKEEEEEDKHVHVLSLSLFLGHPFKSSSKYRGTDTSTTYIRG